MTSTAKLRAELERLKLQVAALTQGRRGAIRLIGDEPIPEGTPPDTLIIRRVFVDPKSLAPDTHSRAEGAKNGGN
jgi:hypothetical protein